MNAIVISPSILDKLNVKHNVTRREIEQCFENREGQYVKDTREEHKTDPATLWFVSPTNQNRKLKVILFLIMEIFILKVLSMLKKVI